MTNFFCDVCEGECNHASEGVSYKSMKTNREVVICSNCLTLATKLIGDAKRTLDLNSLPPSKRKVLLGGVSLKSVNTNKVFGRNTDRKIMVVG